LFGAVVCPEGSTQTPPSGVPPLAAAEHSRWMLGGG
jgi:hypothetical protein